MRFLSPSARRRSSRRRLLCETLEARTLLTADPYLVKEFASGDVVRSSNPAQFVDVGGITFFVAETPHQGRELWRTDGTAAGTYQVKDINPFPSQSSNPDLLTNVSGKLFFVADDGSKGRELWRSDGTTSGTVLVRDLDEVRYYSSNPTNLTNVGGTLFFTASTGIEDAGELWMTNGTVGGTVRHPLASEMVSPNQLTNLNGQLLYSTRQTRDGELWKTDGTSAGTIKLATILSDGDFINFQGNLYFRAFTRVPGWVGLHFGLWKSDGTIQGTQELARIRSTFTMPYPKTFEAVGNKLYFVTRNNVDEDQVWESDGTSVGTRQTTGIPFNNPNSFFGPRSLTNVNGQLFFTAQTATGRDVWTLDPTQPAGARMVVDLESSGYLEPDILENGNGKLFFASTDASGGRELWQSDGTALGTTLFKEFAPGPESGLASFGVVNNTLYISANDGSHGTELWKSDGTLAGTGLLKDLAQADASGLTATEGLRGITIAGQLYFVRELPGDGVEIWRTDGSTAGTQRLKKIVSPTASARDVAKSLTNVSDMLYFAAETATSGFALWRSDGTAAGTVAVKRFSERPSGLVNVSGKLFFSGSQADSGAELWRSDGTEAGTILVKDICPGPRGSAPSLMVNVNGIVYFAADDGVHSNEVWRSNGTAAGTTLVVDTWPGGGSAIRGSSMRDFVNFNGQLVFLARDGSRGWLQQLYISDGTAAGTVQLTSSVNGAFISELVPVGNTLYFDGYSFYGRRELFKTNGTPSGTVLVREISSAHGPSPIHLTNMNGQLYFSALAFAGGRELWKSNGTAASTQRVKDIFPGKTSSHLANLTNVQGKLWFTATDDIAGTELWQSNGIESGTTLVSDLRKEGSSAPQFLGTIGTTLIFSADTERFGRELWAIDTGAPPDVKIMDDADSGFTLSGPWSRLGEGRNRQVTTAAAGTGQSVATWTFNDLSSGGYRISATWTGGDDHSSNARYRVRESINQTSNLLVKSVNQRSEPRGVYDQGSFWFELGTVTITGSSLVIQLNNNTLTGRVVADAIRIERL